MKIAVYGTLRKGGRLHKSYMQGAKMLGEDFRLDGFDMYSLTAYPYVVKSYKEGSSIVCEVYDVTADRLSDCIGMEQRAGYDIHVVDTPYGEALLCVYPYSSHGDEQVVNGDWLEFARQLELANA